MPDPVTGMAGASLVGGMMNAEAAGDAASAQAGGQVEAARIAVESSKFRPIGVTTNFGGSQFGYDAKGNLNSGGYTLNPFLQAQQNLLMDQSGDMFAQAMNAPYETAPMGAGAQSMFALGQQYLGTSPQEQAQKYMADQQSVLSGSRAKAMADLQAQMQAQGRGGFAIGGDAGMGAANPQMQALLNAQLQQDRELAAQATQGGMDYAKFGAGMMGSGGQMLNSMYGTQAAAYQPYHTALGTMQTVEGLGQNAMELGIGLGSKETAARAQGGVLMGQGMMNAANTIGQQAQQAGSPWGNMLQAGANAYGQYAMNQPSSPPPLFKDSDWMPTGV